MRATSKLTQPRWKQHNGYCFIQIFENEKVRYQTTEDVQDDQDAVSYHPWQEEPPGLLVADQDQQVAGQDCQAGDDYAEDRPETYGESDVGEIEEEEEKSGEGDGIPAEVIDLGRHDLFGSSNNHDDLAFFLSESRLQLNRGGRSDNYLRREKHSGNHADLSHASLHKYLLFSSSPSLPSHSLCSTLT